MDVMVLYRHAVSLVCEIAGKTIPVHVTCSYSGFSSPRLTSIVKALSGLFNTRYSQANFR